MIKTTYPQWFEDFWKQALALKTRTLGSKPDAYKSAKSLKMGAEDVEMVIQTFKSHTDRIRRNKAGWGDFIPDHKDMCRWLKERRWENEEDESVQEVICVDVPRADKVRDRIERIMDRSWAE